MLMKALTLYNYVDLLYQSQCYLLFKSVVTGENCTKPIGKIEKRCYHNITPKKDPYKQYIDSQLVMLDRIDWMGVWYTK